jgi:ABC-type maltose transport system permease subunit
MYQVCSLIILLASQLHSHEPWRSDVFLLTFNLIITSLNKDSWKIRKNTHIYCLNFWTSQVAGRRSNVSKLRWWCITKSLSIALLLYFWNRSSVTDTQSKISLTGQTVFNQSSAAAEPNYHPWSRNALLISRSTFSSWTTFVTFIGIAMIRYVQSRPVP